MIFVVVVALLFEEKNDFPLVLLTLISSKVTYKFTGTTTHALNLGSYNYLGFAENAGTVLDTVVDNVDECGTATCSTPADVGTYRVHRDLEQEVAAFVGKEDAMIFSMGYATNSTTLPALVGKGGTLLDILFELTHHFACRIDHFGCQ